MLTTWVTFLFETANFVVLASVLGWLFFRPVRDILERRRSELELEKRAAAEDRADAMRTLEEARQRRAELEGSLDELRARVEREAEANGLSIVEAARSRTQREQEALAKELATTRYEQARSVSRDAAFAAKEIVVRLLEEIGGPRLENSLIQAACEEIERLRRSGPLAPLAIESAAPLDDVALGAIAKAADIAATGVSHRIDPELVAGVRVLTARGLVDASALGLAAHAERLLVDRLDEEGSRDA